MKAASPRILALVGSRVLYGQERANLLVLERLKADGCGILGVVEDHPAFRTIPDELARRDIPFREAPFVGRREPGYLVDFLVGNPVRYLRARRRLRDLIREFQPTHVHVPNPFAFLTASAGVPADLPIIYRIGDKPAIHNAAWRWIWERIVRRVDHFVANSEFIAGQLAQLGVARHRITVIYNAPTMRVNPPQPARNPDHPHRMLFIGQLTQEKGVDRLVFAFRRIAPEFPDARLVVAGRVSKWSGDDWARTVRDRLLDDPVLAGRVVFPGEIDDVYDYLRSAAFLIVPSVFEEPSPNVVGEAKVAARPSVVFPRGGLPELVKHGEDGFICADTSVESLAEGLRYYLGDPDRARRHGRAALASLERLGVDEFSARWREVYDRTTHGSRQRRPWSEAR